MQSVHFNGMLEDKIKLEHIQGFMLLDRRRRLITLMRLVSNWLPARGLSHGVLVGLSLLQMIRRFDLRVV